MLGGFLTNHPLFHGNIFGALSLAKVDVEFGHLDLQRSSHGQSHGLLFFKRVINYTFSVKMHV